MNLQYYRQIEQLQYEARQNEEVAMPPELRKAHQANDRAVMQAYGFDVKTMTESSCVAELMKLYQQLIN